MKRLSIMLLVLLLLLAGCGKDIDPTEPPTEPTEPPKPWTQTAGLPWDREGVLLEMPLTIPDGMHYSQMTGFGGDLLLWSQDSHLKDQYVLELCLVELDDGTIIAQRDIPFTTYTVPQILGEDLYLCDDKSGQILQLNKALKTVRAWNVEPAEGQWLMGDGEILYQLIGSSLTARDLAAGTVKPVMEGDPEVSWMSEFGRYASLDYFRADTGMGDMAVLDLCTGEMLTPGIEGDFSSVYYLNDDWLCCKYMDANLSYLSVDGGPAKLITETDGSYNLLEEGYLMESGAIDGGVALYDMEGRLVSAATVFEEDSGYFDTDLIWNESLGGYFLNLRGFDESSRLLFWDITKSAGGADLILTEVPQPDEATAQLKQRAEELGTRYGLSILVGDDCDTVFDEFSAERVDDWERLTMALNTLEEALDTYPEGFLRQLRWENIRGIQIQLITNLWADGSGRYGDGYAAFAQPRWDHYLLVMDIEDTSAQTYYHEFSHIIDSYLEWDAGRRPDALFSEEGWADLNPHWFTGYSYDYSDEHYLYDYDYFIDGYSTIKPTEDRARVLEYAMGGFKWTFEDSPGVHDKLDYYCRCIRDAFDDTGWPEVTPWEEPLK